MESLVEAYHAATDKCLYDNLISTLFNVLDNDKMWSADQNLQQMDEKFEKEKQELLDKREMTLRLFIIPSCYVNVGKQSKDSTTSYSIV